MSTDSQYSKEVTKIFNKDTIADYYNTDVTALLSPVDIELHEVFSIPIRVLEHSLLELILDEAETADKAKRTKGKKLRVLFTRLGILEEAISKVDESIDNLNDTLKFKVNRKKINKGINT